MEISSNLPDALENNVAGFLVNHGGQSTDGSALPPQPVIRGLSTIYSNAAPLSVVDNVIYDGNILNLNPEDIQSVVVLKDAAATARYGVRAANGVVVYTTKRGSSSIPQVQYASSMTWQSRPRLSSTHPIAAADEIAYEQNAYRQGLYNGAYGDPSHPEPVPPVASLLHAVDAGRISSADANARLADWATVDSRRDISKYLYTNSLIAREHLGISGATASHSYYYGFGFDHQPSTLVAAGTDRYTFRTSNSFVLNTQWSVDADAGFTLGTVTNGDNAGAAYRSLHGSHGYPAYQRLVGRTGNPLPVFTDYNPDFLRQLRQLGYIDESFKPVADVSQEQHSVQTTDFLASAGLHYRPHTSIDVELNYSVEYQATQEKDAFSDSAYFVRDLQNTFAQPDGTGDFTYPVPAGGIATFSNSNLTSNQLRLQLNVHPQWNADHRLTALVGTELHSAVNTGQQYRYYGYDEDASSANSTMDFNTSYYSYLTEAASQIPNPQVVSRTTDHFLSGYMEAMYVDHQRLYATISLREDAANLFGVRTNQKVIPLWSAGLGYELDSLRDYPWRTAIPLLKIRTSYGVGGNIGRQVSAYTTASSAVAGTTTPLPNATILSPPDKNLRWEKVGQFNAGLDFALHDEILSGSFDYYIKSATDLLGKAPMDPTLGLVLNAGTPASFYGNVASMRGYGLEARLTAVWVRRHRIRWSSDLLVSQSVTKVTNYLLPLAAGNAYLDPNVVNPIPGKPLYAVYSFRWQGLDPTNGDPQVYFGGRASKNWDSAWASTTLSEMRYHGSSEPTWHGSLRNTFDAGHWSLTVLLSFKLGYYFRRPSISYGALQNLWIGNSDYARRWQHPGDERRTNIPSAVYNADRSRDDIYTFSSALVDRGDQVRLEDVQLSHHLILGKGEARSAKRQLTIFADVANPGIIWRANKDRIDPYYVNSPTDGPRWSVGVRGTF